MNSVHLTNSSAFSQSAQVAAAPPTAHFFRPHLDRQQLLPVSQTASLHLLSPSCCEWEVNSTAASRSQPNLSSTCFDPGLSALPLLHKAPTSHHKGLIHSSQWPFLQSLPEAKLKTSVLVITLNFSMPLTSLTLYYSLSILNLAILTPPPPQF